MGIFKRVNDIISANFNELIDEFEDPEKMLKQAVREMETAVETALDGAAKVIANEKLLGKQLDDHRRQLESWQQRALEAVRRNDDEAARHALTRKAEHEKIAAALRDQFTEAETAGRKLRRQIGAMRVRLAEARRKQVTLTARKQAAEARTILTSEIAGFSIHHTAFSKFDRMCGKIEQAEAEAEALIELAGCESPEMEGDLDIEAQLRELKNVCESSR